MREPDDAEKTPQAYLLAEKRLVSIRFGVEAVSGEPAMRKRVVEVLGAGLGEQVEALDSRLAEDLGDEEPGDAFARRGFATTSIERYASSAPPSTMANANPITSSLSTVTSADADRLERMRSARSGSAGSDGQPSASQSASTPAR